MNELLMKLWAKALADAPLCFAMTCIVGLMVFYGSTLTFASQEDVATMQAALVEQGTMSDRKLQAILIRIDISDELNIIASFEKDIRDKEREIADLQLNRDQFTGDAATIVRNRLTALNSDINEITAEIRRREQRLIELRNQADALK